MRRTIHHRERRTSFSAATRPACWSAPGPYPVRGCPQLLIEPLKAWLYEALREPIAQRVMLHMKMSRISKAGYVQDLVSRHPSDLMTVVDATFQLHPGGDAPDAYGDAYRDEWTERVFVPLLDKLDAIHVDGSSLYRVDRDSRCLVGRVDQTVQDAADAAIKSAPHAAADHLRAAWVAAYGLSPDPDKVFGESIRDVEELACPLVEQKKAAQNTATIGTVIGELRNSGHKWELLLPGKDGKPRDVDSIVAMMETLWQAQVSRHGGAHESRRHTQEEAEAAVHLAALLVQWLSTGVLRRR